MPPDTLETRVAVLETRIENLEENHNKLEELHEKSNGALLQAVNSIRADLKEIYEFINKSKGSLAALLLAASGITGIIVAVVDWTLTHFLK